MVCSKIASEGIVGIQGILIVLGGIPVYYLMLWHKKRRSATDLTKAA